MKHNEFFLHSSFVEAFKEKHPYEANFLCLIDNNATSARECANKKRLGLLKGMSDIVVFLPRSGFNGLLIEFKDAENGKLSDEQLALHDRFAKEGYLIVIVRTQAAGLEFVERYLKHHINHTENRSDIKPATEIKKKKSKK